MSKGRKTYRKKFLKLTHGMTPSERFVSEVSYATAFVGFFTEAKRLKLKHPGEYAANEAMLVVVEAAYQWSGGA